MKYLKDLFPRMLVHHVFNFYPPQSYPSLTFTPDYVLKAERRPMGRRKPLHPLLCSRAQGLRGIASILIVVYHCTWAFAPDYAYPVGTQHGHPIDARPRILQLPFLRIIVMGGHFWVACFFVLSGYVCSIKCLRLARAGTSDEARKVAATSVIRRVIRLFIPATAACVLSWSCCQLGLYSLAITRTETPWFRETPYWIDGFIPALHSLIWNCVWIPLGCELIVVLDLV